MKRDGHRAWPEASAARPDDTLVGVVLVAKGLPLREGFEIVANGHTAGRRPAVEVAEVAIICAEVDHRLRLRRLWMEMGVRGGAVGAGGVGLGRVSSMASRDLERRGGWVGGTLSRAC